MYNRFSVLSCEGLVPAPTKASSPNTNKNHGITQRKFGKHNANNNKNAKLNKKDLSKTKFLMEATNVSFQEALAALKTHHMDEEITLNRLLQKSSSVWQTVQHHHKSPDNNNGKKNKSKMQQIQTHNKQSNLKSQNNSTNAKDKNQNDVGEKDNEKHPDDMKSTNGDNDNDKNKNSININIKSPKKGKHLTLQKRKKRDKKIDSLEKSNHHRGMVETSKNVNSTVAEPNYANNAADINQANEVNSKSIASTNKVTIELNNTHNNEQTNIKYVRSSQCEKSLSVLAKPFHSKTDTFVKQKKQKIKNHNKTRTSDNTKQKVNKSTSINHKQTVYLHNGKNKLVINCDNPEEINHTSRDVKQAENNKRNTTNQLEDLNELKDSNSAVTELGKPNSKSYCTQGKADSSLDKFISMDSGYSPAITSEININADSSECADENTLTHIASSISDHSTSNLKVKENSPYPVPDEKKVKESKEYLNYGKIAQSSNNSAEKEKLNNKSWSKAVQKPLSIPELKSQCTQTTKYETNIMELSTEKYIPIEHKYKSPDQFKKTPKQEDTDSKTEPRVIRERLEKGKPLKSQNKTSRKPIHFTITEKINSGKIKQDQNKESVSLQFSNELENQNEEEPQDSAEFQKKINMITGDVEKERLSSTQKYLPVDTENSYVTTQSSLDVSLFHDQDQQNYQCTSHQPSSSEYDKQVESSNSFFMFHSAPAPIRGYWTVPSAFASIIHYGPGAFEIPGPNELNHGN